MFIFIQFLCALLGMGTLLVCMSQMLSHRLTVHKITAISLLYSLLILLRQFFDWNSAAVLTIQLSYSILLLCIPVSLFEGKLWKRIGVFLLIISELLICNLIARIMLNHAGTFSSVYIGPFYPMVYEVFTNALYILVGSISVMLWKMAATRRFQPFFLLFLILPVGQAIMVYSFLFTSWTTFWLMGIILSMVANLVLLIYTIAQEKKKELEEKLCTTRRKMELEQYHYREVEQRHVELDKIRQDFKDQLLDITLLLRSGKTNSAQNLIHTLSKEINQTRENMYCAIPVINAILTEKAKECAAVHIDLEIELDIPVQLSVEQIHLCSILSNLLDNAIHACKQLSSAASPTIRLDSMMNGDYLFIKTVNPSSRPSMKPLPGHGYGSRILSDLSAQYGGYYQSEYRDGVFTAVVSILAVNS